jgi:hypothetical protein
MIKNYYVFFVLKVVALDTQCLITVKTRDKIVITALDLVTTCTGNHLPGSRIKNLLPYGMCKSPVQSMTFVADIIDRSLGHVGIVGSMRRMAINAGICHLVLEWSLAVSQKCIRMTGSTDIFLFTFEQGGIISGVGRMTGGTSVFAVAQQMVVRGGHLFSYVCMAFETGIDCYRNTFAGMAVIATICIWIMQDIAYKTPPVAAMGAMTGRTVLYRRGKVGMFRLHGLGRMTGLTELVRFLDEQIAISRLVRIMAGAALSLGVRCMCIFELLGQLGMTVEAECRYRCFEHIGLVR